MPFQIDWAGETFNTDDLTGREIVQLEKLLDVGWARIRPHAEARHCLYVLATFLLRSRTGGDVEQLLESELLDAVTVGWLAGNVRWVDGDDLPTQFDEGLPDPKAASGGSTGT